MTRVLAAVLILVGIVLLPLRAAAATLPTLIAYDAEVRSTATARVEAGPSVRPDRGNAPEYVYGAVHVEYDIAVNPQVVDGAGAVHAYDGALELVERRELGEGPIYDAPAATTAAEGTTTLYRAVSQAELEDIGATGGFRGGAGSMGNKWFAESAEDAAAWGKKFFNFDKEPIFTVRVQVPNSVADQMMRVPMLDGIGPARSAEGAVIDLINGQGSIDALGANAVP